MTSKEPIPTPGTAYRTGGPVKIYPYTVAQKLGVDSSDINLLKK